MFQVFFIQFDNMTPQKVGIVGLFSLKVGKSRALDQKVGKSRKSRKSRDTGQPAWTIPIEFGRIPISGSREDVV